MSQVGLADAMTDLGFPMAQQTIAKIESSPFILHRRSVRGFVYEVETGSLREPS